MYSKSGIKRPFDGEKRSNRSIMDCSRISRSDKIVELTNAAEISYLSGSSRPARTSSTVRNADSDRNNKTRVSNKAEVEEVDDDDDDSVVVVASTSSKNSTSINDRLDRTAPSFSQMKSNGAFTHGTKYSNRLENPFTKKFSSNCDYNNSSSSSGSSNRSQRIQKRDDQHQTTQKAQTKAFANAKVAQTYVPQHSTNDRNNNNKNNNDNSNNRVLCDQTLSSSDISSQDSTLMTNSTVSGCSRNPHSSDSNTKSMETVKEGFKSSNTSTETNVDSSSLSKYHNLERPATASGRKQRNGFRDWMEPMQPTDHPIVRSEHTRQQQQLQHTSVAQKLLQTSENFLSSNGYENHYTRGEMNYDIKGSLALTSCSKASNSPLANCNSGQHVLDIGDSLGMLDAGNNYSSPHSSTTNTIGIKSRLQDEIMSSDTNSPKKKSLTKKRRTGDTIHNNGRTSILNQQVYGKQLPQHDQKEYDIESQVHRPNHSNTKNKTKVLDQGYQQSSIKNDRNSNKIKSEKERNSMGANEPSHRYLSSQKNRKNETNAVGVVMLRKAQFKDDHRQDRVKMVTKKNSPTSFVFEASKRPRNGQTTVAGVNSISHNNDDRSVMNEIVSHKDDEIMKSVTTSTIPNSQDQMIDQTPPKVKELVDSDSRVISTLTLSRTPTDRSTDTGDRNEDQFDNVGVDEDDQDSYSSIQTSLVDNTEEMQGYSSVLLKLKSVYGKTELSALSMFPNHLG